MSRVVIRPLSGGSPCLDYVYLHGVAENVAGTDLIEMSRSICESLWHNMMSPKSSFKCFVEFPYGTYKEAICFLYFDAHLWQPRGFVVFSDDYEGIAEIKKLTDGKKEESEAAQEAVIDLIRGKK